MIYADQVLLAFFDVVQHSQKVTKTHTLIFICKEKTRGVCSLAIFTLRSNLKSKEEL
jgi:hypothetical protein